MELIKTAFGKIKAVYCYLAIYFIINLFFLNRFPFMHSDESWLSGLTRSMMNGGLDSTETFFDLAPRYPHAIKVLFHIIQMGFLQIFGYELFSFRLISLLSGIVVLLLLYKIAKILFKKERTALFVIIAMSIEIQFVYASHFARQEIIILAGLLGVMYVFLKNHGHWKMRHDIIASVITGLSIGVHPNSFLIALAAGALYLYYLVRKENIRLRNLFVYILITGAIAGVFVGISYIFDSEFISHYLKYGNGLGVSNTLGMKYDGLFNYYRKLFLQSSGTYYTPFIKVELIVFAIAVAGSLTAVLNDKGILRVILPLAAVNLGFVIIGRYSQPSVIFIFPFCLLLIFYLIENIFKKKSFAAVIIICIGLLVNSIAGIIPYLGNEYNEYLDGIRGYVPYNAVVLANLNTEYAFSNGNMYDYRNLNYLYEKEMSFDEYVENRGIEYIVYPEEMDFIYERRPVWNMIYGNVYPYYGEMETYLLEECEKVYEFTSDYAMRITRYTGEKEWKVAIYRVNKNEK